MCALKKSSKLPQMATCGQPRQQFKCSWVELVATGPQCLAVMVVGVAFGFGISGNVAENGKMLQAGTARFCKLEWLDFFVQDGRLTFFPDPRIEGYTDIHRMIFHATVYVYSLYDI